MAYTGRSAGVYEIRSVDYPDLPAHTVAASLANPIESKLIATGDYEPYRQHTPSEISLDNTPTLLDAPLWQILVLLALGLTTLEWFTYNRRWTV